MHVGFDVVEACLIYKWNPKCEPRRRAADMLRVKLGSMCVGSHIGDATMRSIGNVTNELEQVARFRFER